MMTRFCITILDGDEAADLAGGEPSCHRCGEPIESSPVVEIETIDSMIRSDELVCRSCLNPAELARAIPLIERVIGEPVRQLPIDERF